MELLTFLAVAAIFFLSGSVQGMTGFGSALIAMPLLSFFFDAQTAVPLCALNSIIITGSLLFSLRRHVYLRRILPLCLAALPGAVVGITFLRHMSTSTFKVLLGSLLISYSLYSLMANPRPRSLHPRWAYLAGFLSGAINSAFGTGGPPTIIYTALNDWSKDVVKATLTGFFAFNSLLTVIVHYVSGMATNQVFKAFLASALAVFLGTLIGSRLYTFLSQKTYLRITYSCLLIMGITLVYSV